MCVFHGSCARCLWERLPRSHPELSSSSLCLRFVPSITRAWAAQDNRQTPPICVFLPEPIKILLTKVSQEPVLTLDPGWGKHTLENGCRATEQWLTPLKQIILLKEQMGPRDAELKLHMQSLEKLEGSGFWDEGELSDASGREAQWQQLTFNTQSEVACFEAHFPNTCRYPNTCIAVTTNQMFRVAELGRMPA